MFNLLNLFTSAAQCRSHLTRISVRWKRKPKKPVWLGVAKTKMFKIPVKKELPEWEKTELDRLNYIYDRQLTSLKKFMSTDKSNRVSHSSFSEINQKNIEQSKLLIDKWNAKSAELRKVRLEKKELAEYEAASRILSKANEKDSLIKAKVDEIVSAELIASKTYVTKENLDTILDECLRNIQDYNFALDLKGNIYKGESNVPVGKLTPVNMTEMGQEYKTSDLKDQQVERVHGEGS